MDRRTIVVTGGAGFIGSAVVRSVCASARYNVVNVDKLTYAGSLKSLGEYERSERHIFKKVDICDGPGIREIFSEFKPAAVMHLAAESHVDRSIDGPGTFIETNIKGTYTLLEAAREYWDDLDEKDKEQFRFHHVSTDEVYGSLGATGLFREDSAYRPNSPYSASKASSDHLVRAWKETYGLPTMISNCSNNYGPYQYPEKLIPLMIAKALSSEQLPVYGKGENVRDWLYVVDHAEALLSILESGVPGQVYNVGGHNEVKNIEVVNKICSILDEVRPRSDGRSYTEQIAFVADRPGHDQRYAIDAGKIERELGWKPSESFETGLYKTVMWYLENPGWGRDTAQEYRGERLGLGARA